MLHRHKCFWKHWSKPSILSAYINKPLLNFRQGENYLEELLKFVLASGCLWFSFSFFYILWCLWFRSRFYDFSYQHITHFWKMISTSNSDSFSIYKLWDVPESKFLEDKKAAFLMNQNFLGLVLTAAVLDQTWKVESALLKFCIIVLAGMFV